MTTTSVHATDVTKQFKRLPRGAINECVKEGKKEKKCCCYHKFGMREQFRMLWDTFEAHNDGTMARGSCARRIEHALPLYAKRTSIYYNS